MRRCLLLAGLSLLALGCDDEAGARDEDAGPSPPTDGGMVPADGAVEPHASVTCPPPDADDRVVVTLDGPGRWRLEGCEGDQVELLFTVPPDTAFTLDATSGPDADPSAYAHPPSGLNDTDMPVEQHGVVLFNDESTPVVTLRWVECLAVDSCGADRYCAPRTYACVDCADGDEVFDVGAMDAPRTDAAARAVDGTTIEGVACEGFDDWYVLNQAAGQALSVESLQSGPMGPPANHRMLHAYLADPAAERLADLVPLPFEDGAVRAPEADRTVWLRASTSWRPLEPGEDGGGPPPEAQQPYIFELGGCRGSGDCLPWSYCSAPEAEGPAGCMPCAGEQDATGDHGTEAEPVRLEPGAPVEGNVCGADMDGYALTVEAPGVQVVLVAAEDVILRDDTGLNFGRQRRRVYRRGAPGIPDEVVLTVEAPGDASRDGEIRPYTIETEVLEACDVNVDPLSCPVGYACMDGVCLDGAPMGESCEVACARSAVCVASDAHCPGIGAEDREGLYAECMGRCAQVPVLAAQINDLETCAEIIDLVRRIDSSFGDRCDGP